ncbi:hypothetical protein [Williamwhitmania taraxaci]|uniref:Cxxc_20_cxxc protein n=1 Tax=Williamwhitmania taraxaci TaxID=1640674 RepID=A0A1G6K297_9BACT|nr:hypothetical protein [Williamwhitmania taraxaci]SDC24416.1 cxxc_20_cxxc protein [Williamwhitmania taraxaci]
MQTRTCPHCAHKYSAITYILKVLSRFDDYRGWPCEQCGTILTVDPKRRMKVSLIAFLPTIIVNTILISFRRDMGISLLGTFLFAGAFLLVWVLLIYSFDNFKLKE